MSDERHINENGKQVDLPQEAEMTLKKLENGEGTLADVRSTIYKLFRDGVISNEQAESMKKRAKDLAFSALHTEISHTKNIQAMRRELDLAEEYQYITAGQKNELVSLVHPKDLEKVNMEGIRSTFIETSRHLQKPRL